MQPRCPSFWRNTAAPRGAIAHAHARRANTLGLSSPYITARSQAFPSLIPPRRTITPSKTIRTFTSSSNMSTPQNSEAFEDALKFRRSYYALQKKSSVSDKHLQQIIHDTVISVPSAFNGQSGRLVVLLHKDHQEFWGFVWDALKSHVEGTPKEAGTRSRMDGFAGAYGTVRFPLGSVPLSPLFILLLPFLSHPIFHNDAICGGSRIC